MVSLLLFAAFPNLPVRAITQLPTSTPPADSEPADTSEVLNPVTNPLWPQAWDIATAEIDSAPVYLDGKDLFKLTAPPVEGQHPAANRALEIQRRLQQVAADYHQSIQATSEERSDQTQLPTIDAEIDPPTQLPVIMVNESPLLTVTSLDAQMSGHTDPEIRASYLVPILRRAIVRYHQQRQPSFIRQQIGKVSVAALCVALLQLILHRVGKRFKRRQARLTGASTQIGRATTRLGGHPFVLAPGNVGAYALLDLIKARLDNRQKRRLNETLLGLLFIVRTSLWIALGLWSLQGFAQSRWLATLIVQWIKIPAQLLLIVGIAFAIVRIASLIIDKVVLALQEGAQWAPETSERLSLRFTTFSQVAKGVTGSLVFALAGLAALAILGVQLAPLLAGAGIVGLGISLAAQSLIKDIINGFFILFEDQFGLGDVITVNGLSGMVEALNLRITQLRNAQGELITIPNSQITTILNQSKDWSQADLKIPVAPHTDVQKAIALMESVAIDLSKDPNWQKNILEPPEVLGIESVDQVQVVLRLLLRTRPLKQWDVVRELRLRTLTAFDEAGIEWVGHAYLPIHPV